MRSHPKRYLQVGDTVTWVDPDNSECSGQYRVQEIVTESGLVEDDESVLVLSDDDGHCTEVYVMELA